MDGLDVSTISDLLGHALGHEVTQFGIAFTIAAWLHSGRVKKEIKSQMANMISAVDKVAEVLKQDLAEQGYRLGNLQTGLDKLATRVDNLEKKGD